MKRLGDKDGRSGYRRLCNKVSAGEGPQSDGCPILRQGRQSVIAQPSTVGQVESPEVYLLVRANLQDHLSEASYSGP